MAQVVKLDLHRSNLFEYNSQSELIGDFWILCGRLPGYKLKH